MKKNEAAQLVNQTFTRAFSEEQFVNFVNNLLPGMKPPSSQLVTGAQLKQGFQEHIHSYKRLGTFHDPLGDVLDVVVVKLKRHESLDRARTRQRNLMAHYLNDRQKDAVLVAYITEDSTDWRFSFVKLAYQTAITEKGIIKPKQVFTPARRYSFLVGEHEPNHTAQKQLGDLLMQEGRLSLAQIEEAFNIESVTKEFFEKYKDLFLQIKENLDQIVVTNQQVKDEFERCKIETANFAKKLLGQIVFLYFLQKKGWLGVAKDETWGTGDKKFLHNIFKNVGDRNYFDEILEPFFYEALAIERKGDFYPTLQCKVPFLNGGLFEPLNGYDWENTYINLDNKVFEEVFKVFNLFNFTVREDEPLEKEVAVDPEMLGKVFENLLEITDRKSKGAYYTPREIVHYMCQESLINYLDTALNAETEIVSKENIETFIREGEFSIERDQAREEGKLKDDKHGLPESIREHAKEIDFTLANVKICDPAIGSGAFPVGMMSEIVRARNVLTNHLQNQLSRDAYTFKWHCIENSLYGVDIEPSAVEIAKLRLWLSLIVDEDSYDQIRPLPNLDYRIVCGNSLLSVQKDLFNYTLYPELEKKKLQYFGTTSPKNKDVLRREIENLIDQLTDGKKLFDFEVYFSEVFSSNSGFDVVIGNPPYVRQELIRDQKTRLKAEFPEIYTGRADLYVYFFGKGLQLLKESGVLTFITPNKFMRANYGSKIRDVLSQKTQMKNLIDFHDLPVFEATTYPMVMITKNLCSPENTLWVLEVEDLSELENISLAVEANSFPVLQSELESTGWQLTSPIVQALMKKIKLAGEPLENFLDGDYFSGIKTGRNNAFIINKEQRAKLIVEDIKSSEIIKPFLRGRDVKRWQIQDSGLFIIFTKHGVDISQYPAIEKYLKSFKESLEKRATSSQHHWYELQQPQMGIYEKFEKPKIVYPDIAAKTEFALDTGNYYPDMTLFAIASDEIFLLAILNSLVTDYLLRNISSTIRGGYIRFKKIYLSQISIPKVTDRLKNEICQIAVQCLDTSELDSSKLPQLENDLNELIYRAYALTEEEIAIVEGSEGR